MVVTRKTPLAPSPPTSRTNSSQPTGRSAKGKAPQTVPDAPEPSSPLVNGAPRAQAPESDMNAGKSGSNGEPHNKNSKGKNKSKGKKHHKKKKSPSLADVLFRFLLLFFTIYTVAICPNDTALQSPICRALFEYRRLVLEPLLLPPINFALSHPSVSPYVTRLKPHYNKVVEVVTPVVVRTQVEWNARVVPQWKKRLVPQWNKYAAPQLAKLDSKIDPYRNRLITEYNTRLAPPIHLVFSKLNVLRVRSTPYVQLVASKTYTGYKKTVPYAKPLWVRIKLLMKRVLARAREVRMEFVDPHVNTIWEKVVELSSGKPLPGSPVKDANDPQVDDAPPEDTGVMEGQTLTMEPETTEAPTVAPISSSSRASESVVISSDTASSVLSSVIESESVVEKIGDPSSALAQETLDSASSVASASASGASSVVSPLVDEISSAAAPDTTAVVDDEYVDDEDLDLEEFYRELELESSSDDDIPSESAEPPPKVTLTEDQLAEAERLHKIQVAKKRADIEGRHTKWEEQVQAMSVSMDTQLRNSLSEIRNAAVVKLSKSPRINKELDALVKDAEKFLKGAEGYYKNLKKDDGKSDLEKQELWVKVVGKVEGKFTVRLGEAEGVVNAWYMDVLNEEREEVKNAVFAVKDIADRGQADVGLDYAWLDDVTVEDWTRYHDLMRSHMDFAEQANMIQNGTHPNAPPNPLLSALSNLQTDVQEIVMGFQTRLRKLKLEGQHAFGGIDEPIDNEDNDKDDFDHPSEPEISILPVDPNDDQLEAEAENGPPMVVIGRSKQEVLDALGKVEAEEEQADRVTDLKTDPEEVESIVPEAEAKHRSPVAAAAAHVEL